jgi:hypothetical protein
MMAILTACAVSGAFANVGHCHRVMRADLVECERSRPRAESDMADAGMVVRFSRCDGTVTNQARNSHDR